MVLNLSECVNAMKTIFYCPDNKESLIHYVDDLVIVRQDMDELISCALTLLLRLQNFNVKVNPGHNCGQPQFGS